MDSWIENAVNSLYIELGYNEMTAYILSPSAFIALILLYRKKNTGPFNLDTEGVDCILFYSVYSFMMYSYMVYLLYVIFHNGLY